MEHKHHPGPLEYKAWYFDLSGCNNSSFMERLQLISRKSINKSYRIAVKSFHDHG
jgi:hypothetical protein